MDLSMLNPEQRLAAETLDGPVLVLAGAGSGKTRALTYRAANLMDSGVAPWHLLCLTFTNKAAREMKERITRLVGDQAEEAWISTFHSTCARILRRDIDKLGYSRAFVIFDTDDQERVLKEQLKQQNIDDKYLPIRELMQKISGAKNKLQDADEWFSASPRDWRSQLIHDVFLGYQKRLRELNALDFDDLLIRTLELMTEHPPVLEYYQRRFTHVMVDEYQDTNYAQYMLVRLITRESRNLCVVGDDDQSIYGWRGADIHNILNFEKDYPDTKVIKLEENYRSTATILDAANQVIAHNENRKDKHLWTEAGDGEPIRLFTATDERTEAAWVVTKMLNLRDVHVSWSDMAVLYRSNSQSRVLEERLTQSGIPYRVFGGPRFYERREIKEIVAYLRVLVNPADDISLARIINVPKRAIGDSTVQELQRHAREQDMPLYAALTDLPASLASRPRKCVTDFAMLMSELLVMRETMPLDGFMDVMMNRTGLMAAYEQDESDEGKTRLENIREFMNGVSVYVREHPEATLEDYLENIALVSDLDGLAPERDGAVTLMTMHSAKGLEFDNVFLVGMEEGVFPNGRAIQEEERLEEERRLCYVGITRARKRLFLSKAMSRMYFSMPNHNEPSRFLGEIPERLIKNESAACERVYAAPQPRERVSRAPVRRQLARPGQPLTIGGNPLNIPGVQKGFVASRAQGTAPKAQFAPGDRVMHRKFGEGRVTEVTPERITISFIAYGDKTFGIDLAPIVKMED